MVIGTFLVILLYKVTEKLRPVTGENLDFWDGYRGEHRLAWSVLHGKGGRMFEIFAIRCRCGVWWGWTYLEKAREMLKKLEDNGCLRCR